MTQVGPDGLSLQNPPYTMFDEVLQELLTLCGGAVHSRVGSFEGVVWGGTVCVGYWVHI